MATFELGNVQIDKLNEPAGGQTATFGDTITAPGIDAPTSSVFNIAATNATALNLGHGGLSTYIYGSSTFVGGVIDTISSGTLTIGNGNATTVFSNANTITLSANGALNLNCGGGAVTITDGAHTSFASDDIRFGNNAGSLLKFSGSVATNITLSGDNTFNLGTQSNRWKDGYFGGKLVAPHIQDTSTGSGYLDFNSSAQYVTLANSYANSGAGPVTSVQLQTTQQVFQVYGSNALTVGYTSSTFGGDVLPTNNNTQSFGSSSSKWKDGYFGGTLTTGELIVNINPGFSTSFSTSGYAMTYTTALGGTNNAAGFTLVSTGSPNSPIINLQNSSSEFMQISIDTKCAIFSITGYESLYISRGDNRPSSVIAGGLAADKIYNDSAFLTRNRHDGAPAAVIAKRTSSTTADILQVTDENLTTSYFRMSASGDGYFAGNIKANTAQIGTATALPIATSANRGQLYIVQGGSGTRDTLYVNLKADDDSYDWIQVVDGGAS